MAEHSAVNRRVVGSSPTWGASRLVNNGKPFVMFGNDRETCFLSFAHRICTEMVLDRLSRLIFQSVGGLGVAHSLRTKLTNFR